MNFSDEKDDCCCGGNSSKIHCEVENCVYHDENDKCSARQIQVGPEDAETRSETICGTFKEK